MQPGGGAVTLTESVALVSQGTTGLVTWEAGLHLAEWAGEHLEAFSGRYAHTPLHRYAHTPLHRYAHTPLYRYQTFIQVGTM